MEQKYLQFDYDGTKIAEATTTTKRITNKDERN